MTRDEALQWLRDETDFVFWDGSVQSEVAKILDAFATTVRREAFEEAAAILDQWARSKRFSRDTIMGQTLAAEIRALQEAEG